MFRSRFDSETYLLKAPKDFPETTESKIQVTFVALMSQERTKVLTEKTSKKNRAKNSGLPLKIAIIVFFFFTNCL